MYFTLFLTPQSVGVILGIIAIKMVFETFDIELLSPLMSLMVVLSVLGAGVVASLISGYTKPLHDTHSLDESSS